MIELPPRYEMIQQVSYAAGSIFWIFGPRKDCAERVRTDRLNLSPDPRCLILHGPSEVACLAVTLKIISCEDEEALLGSVLRQYISACKFSRSSIQSLSLFLNT